MRKKGGDCLSSWGERKKRTSEEKRRRLSVVGASEKSGRVRKKRRTVSVVGASEKSGRVRKKGGDCFSSWGKRKKRTSEEKRRRLSQQLGQAKKAGANLKNQHAINLS